MVNIFKSDFHSTQWFLVWIWVLNIDVVLRNCCFDNGNWFWTFVIEIFVINLSFGCERFLPMSEIDFEIGFELWFDVLLRKPLAKQHRTIKQSIVVIVFLKTASRFLFILMQHRRYILYDCVWVCVFFTHTTIILKRVYFAGVKLRELFSFFFSLL